MEPKRRQPIEERIVRVALPVHLIVSMDRLLAQQTGGFTTRQELIREAIENQVLELSHDAAPPEPTVGQYEPQTLSLSPEIADRASVRIENLAATALLSADPGWTMTASTIETVDEPLLGLHNRDYPSLWALRRLADHCHDGPRQWDEVVDELTREAWAFGAGLRELERREGLRGLTALFPVNEDKPAAAERGFIGFAIGSTPRHPTPDAPVPASGPLPAWKVVQLAWDGPVLVAGLTADGWSLLGSTEGITLELPHGESHARAFLDHIRRHAPADHVAFVHALQAISEGPDRPHLLQSFGQRFGGTEAVAGSLAQGYVARAREWGLVEPKLVDGRYWLTAFGRTALEELAT